MQTPSVNYRNADRSCGGKLAEILAQSRADGLSYASIAARLFADYGIEVSAPTVGAWLRSIDTEQVA